MTLMTEVNVKTAFISFTLQLSLHLPLHSSYHAIIYYVQSDLVSSFGVGMVRGPDTSDTLVYALHGALHLLSGHAVRALEHLELAVNEPRVLVLAADGLLGAVDKLASDEGVADILDGHKLDLGVCRRNLLEVLVKVHSVLVGERGVGDGHRVVGDVSSPITPVSIMSSL